MNGATGVVENVPFFALPVLYQQEVIAVSDDRLKMLKWHHLKVELDNREQQWPEGSSYEFDHDRQTVNWLMGERRKAPFRLVWHLTDEELSLPDPSGIADRMIQKAIEVERRDD